MSEDMDKKTLILGYERKFAAGLANNVLAKPRLSVWMIFIPFIFIFYFQDLAKYKKQRKAFIENYLSSREKALNEAEAAMDENRKPDPVRVARQADLKRKAKEKYGFFLTVLADHYTRLLGAAGDTYDTLLKSVYGTRKMNYLLFLNQLNVAEKELNKALKSSLAKTNGDIGETIRKIEINSDRLRRTEAERIWV